MLSICSKLKEGRLRRGRFLPPPRYSNPTPARLIPTPGELGPAFSLHCVIISSSLIKV